VTLTIVVQMSDSHHQLLVVSHGAKDTLVEEVPRYVLHNRSVSREYPAGLKGAGFGWCGIHIP